MGTHWKYVFFVRLSSSISHVRKQLQSLWRRKVVNLLFEDLLLLSQQEDEDPRAKEDKGWTTEITVKGSSTHLGESRA